MAKKASTKKKSEKAAPRAVVGEIVTDVPPSAQGANLRGKSAGFATSSDPNFSMDVARDDEGIALPDLDADLHEHRGDLTDRHGEFPDLPDLPDLKDDLEARPKMASRALQTNDPIVTYLAELRKYPLLTREQEQELAKKYYETKDPAAAQMLVTSNLRFVVKIAAEYSRFGARMIDLVQEGNMGLMHAVRDFNPYKGVKLITYAVWWIRGYIREYLMRQYSLVKIGTTQNQKKLFYQLRKEQEALEALGEQPNLKLISQRMGIPEDEVQTMAQRMSRRDISLDRPIDDEGTTTLGDLQKAPDENNLEENFSKSELIDRLRLKIDELRPDLNERELILLEERLMNDEPLTLQEIGEKYGITREAVRQAEARLMKKIKEKFES